MMTHLQHFAAGSLTCRSRFSDLGDVLWITKPTPLRANGIELKLQRTTPNAVIQMPNHGFMIFCNQEMWNDANHIKDQPGITLRLTPCGPISKGD